jgi:3-dehydrosphinganine reductase
MLGIALLLLCPILLLKVFWKRRFVARDKSVLVIGGSSGLGLELSKAMKERGGRVTVSSRNAESLNALRERYGFDTRSLDVTDASTFEDEATSYDAIFCCPGASYPSYFVDQEMERFERTMDLNYLGTVRALKHYSKWNRRPFDFVMVGSTVSLLTFPGYSSYAPTKSALLSFFSTVHDEMSSIGIRLHFFNPSGIQTPGYAQESRSKPAFTKEVEDMSGIRRPEDAARVLLAGIGRRRFITSDFYTYLYQIKYECEDVVDYLLFPVAVAFVFLSKLFISFKYRRSLEAQERIA